jgi:hypothetical protein
MHGMNTSEMRQEPEITFLCEQDGEVERVLKDQLVNILREFSFVQGAYLVLVRYSGSDEPDVALCLASESEDLAVVDACAREFHSMFDPAQHLDILFLSSEQKERLESVCRPFFVR